MIYQDMALTPLATRTGNIVPTWLGAHPFEVP